MSVDKREPVLVASLSVLACLVVFAGGARGQTLVESDFTGTAPAANTPWTQTSVIHTSVVFRGWTLGAGVAAVGTVDDALVFQVDSGPSEPALADAVAQNEYVSCILEPASGQTLDLSRAQFNFSIRRFSWNASRRYAVLSDVGGFAAGQELFTSARFASGNYDATDCSFLLPDAGFASISGPIEFRIYAYEGTYADKNTSLTAFSLVSALPTATLTLSSGPGGDASADPDETVFPLGSTVRISATPSSGFRFGGWIGDITGFGNPRTVTMDADKAVSATFSALPPSGMLVGANLGTVSDYTTSWPFVDIARRLRVWLTRNEDGSGSWNSGKGSLVPVDAAGWPTRVPFDPGDGSPTQIVHTILVNANEAGTYRFYYEGSGVLRLKAGGGWQGLPTGGARTHDFTIATRGQVEIEIAATGPSPNHLRNFKIVHHDSLSTYETEPFHPLFLERLRPFHYLRFMDWARTNSQGIEHWDDRTTPAHYTQARSQGVCLEYMVQLCNRLRKGLWYCVPHKADDNYVREAARLLRDTLDPALKIYIEYSNETWNGIFAQTGYVQDRGEQLGLDEQRWAAGQKYVSLRSVRIWSIFEEELGAAASARLVKVLATQAANVGITDTRAAALNDPAINTGNVFPDALAIAPYFSKNVSPSEIPPATPAYPTVDELLDVVAPAAIATSQGRVIAQKAVADRQGWQLVCYEGGQHFVGVGGAENDATLTGILTSANRDPRMYQRYVEYLDMLRSEGVELLGIYNFTGAWGRYGSWGALEYMEQALADAPKYAAVADWITANVDGTNIFRIRTLDLLPGDDVALKWRSEPAASYNVWSSTNLTSPWNLEASAIPSEGLETVHTLPGAGTGPRMFFRVEER